MQHLIFPVGDLYDVIGSEAEHGVNYAELLEQPAGGAKRKAFNNDLRLLKTLLLAALVPEVECFKQLTAQKLAALNHGTIKAM